MDSPLLVVLLSGSVTNFYNQITILSQLKLLLVEGATDSTTKMATF